ncbi:hypothetical protein [Nocardia arizonensis]|uniref:hypothetical protein n=1 Tax=Nocardia arizonensis TaxID=1141647 RepID=UPI0012E74B0B|nr:hypothetical protein [Nocardia arizonensis]
MITWNSRPALRTAALAGFGAAVLLAAGTAAAAPQVDIVTAAPATIGAAYSCDAGAGVVALKAMVGAANADHPAALGVQEAVTCDGTERTATIDMVAGAGENLPQAGELVQIRVALVDAGDMVVAGQAKLLPIRD